LITVVATVASSGTHIEAREVPTTRRGICRWYGNCHFSDQLTGRSQHLDRDEGRRLILSDAALVEGELEGGAMATQLRTLGWNTWTVVFVLLILILAMAYLAF